MISQKKVYIIYIEIILKFLFVIGVYFLLKKPQNYIFLILFALIEFFRNISFLDFERVIQSIKKEKKELSIKEKKYTFHKLFNLRICFAGICSLVMLYFGHFLAIHLSSGEYFFSFELSCLILFFYALYAILNEVEEDEKLKLSPILFWALCLILVFIFQAKELREVVKLVILLTLCFFGFFGIKHFKIMSGADTENTSIEFLYYAIKPYFFKRIKYIFITPYIYILILSLFHIIEYNIYLIIIFFIIKLRFIYNNRLKEVQ